MKLGFMGLGKMGQPMVGRLLKAGHEVVVRDVQPEAVKAAVSQGAVAADDVAAMLSQLDPVIIWLMIPAGLVDAQLDELLDQVGEGSSIIDGGNSDFRLTLKRAKKAAAKGVKFIDVGTSGGVLGAEAGYCLMVGGDKPAVKSIEPLFEALAQPGGYLHAGPSGAGHFVKMVHNGIEYGAMQALAEGYHLLKEGQFKGLDLAAIGELWQHGSINESLLNGVTAKALAENPEMEGISGYVATSGEGEWAAGAAREHGISVPVLQAALAVRLASQTGEVNFGTKVVAAQRNQFGGHDLNT
ncbi:MAG TPA: decarboxylating 6-phosphogluconate dehydrogenase [Candidatus Polarisedimenticolaceae bacterium]|nr:decarboxylating 6-phosphogluconate dehydrogenase [Candidatus Polarisedimenticolaceae bacterium]